MKKNWRQMKWKDFSGTQKAWFIIMCLVLAAILVAAGLSTSETAEIPDWIALCLVIAGVWAVCRFAGLTPWALMGLDADGDEEE